MAGSSNIKVSEAVAKFKTINDRMEKISNRPIINRQSRTRLASDTNQATLLIEEIQKLIQQLPRDATSVNLSNEFSQESKRFQDITAKINKASSPNQGNNENYPQTYGSNDSYSIPMNQDEYDRTVGQGEKETHQLLEQEQMEKYDMESKRRRHMEVIQVEQDVNDLHDMFKEMDSLVHDQADVLDSIENNIGGARDQMEQAHEELVEAEEYSRKARRKKCIITLVLVLVIAAIVLIVGKSIF